MKSNKDSILDYLESWANFYEDCCVNDNLAPCKFIEDRAKYEVLRDVIKQIKEGNY